MKAYEKCPQDVRPRIRRALETLARNVGGRGRLEGKATKTLHGLDDTFHRLRVGDYRVMYEVIHEDRVILVLGIVHRRELERRIRSR